MKLILLIAAIGSALIVPGLTHGYRYQDEMMSMPSARTRTRGSTHCRSCVSPPRIEEFTEPTPPVSCPASPPPTPRIITTPSVWPAILRSTGTQAGPFILINNTDANQDEVCGARGLVRGDCGVLWSHYMEIFEDCNYTFHECPLTDCPAEIVPQPIGYDYDDTEGYDEEDQTEDPYADMRTGSVIPTPYTFRTILPQCCPCTTPGLWMRKCKTVTLCKHVSCDYGCWAPMYMYFENLLAPTSVGADFLYMGFTFSKTYVGDSNSSTQTNPTAAQMASGVISLYRALVFKPVVTGSTTYDIFSMYRCREFKLNFLFITWITGSSTSRLTVTVKITGVKKVATVDSDQATVTLSPQQPFCFAPCGGFNHLNQVTIEYSGTNATGDDRFCIDNISLCA